MSWLHTGCSFFLLFDLPVWSSNGYAPSRSPSSLLRGLHAAFLAGSSGLSPLLCTEGLRSNIAFSCSPCSLFPSLWRSFSTAMIKGSSSSYLRKWSVLLLLLAGALLVFISAASFLHNGPQIGVSFLLFRYLPWLFCFLHRAHTALQKDEVNL